jgi:hypothetical protein
LSKVTFGKILLKVKIEMSFTNMIYLLLSSFKIMHNKVRTWFDKNLDNITSSEMMERYSQLNVDTVCTFPLMKEYEPVHWDTVKLPKKRYTDNPKHPSVKFEIKN